MPPPLSLLQRLRGLYLVWSGHDVLPERPILEAGAGLTAVDDPVNGRTVLSAPGAGVTLSSATPAQLGTAAPGSAGQASRADHAHDHGDLGGGTLHATATPSAAGFMSSTQAQDLADVAALPRPSFGTASTAAGVVVEGVGEASDGSHRILVGTTAPVGWVSGDFVFIHGTTGVPNTNGLHQVWVDDGFSLFLEGTTASGGYTGGGHVLHAAPLMFLSAPDDATTRYEITVRVLVPGVGYFAQTWSLTLAASGGSLVAADLALVGRTVDNLGVALRRVVGASDDGSGRIKVALNDEHFLSTGERVSIHDVGGVPGASGIWPVEVTSATELVLVGSTWAGAYSAPGMCFLSTGADAPLIEQGLARRTIVVTWSSAGGGTATIYVVGQIGTALTWTASARPT